MVTMELHFLYVGQPRCIRAQVNPDIYSRPGVQNLGCDSELLEDNLAYAQSNTTGDSVFLENNVAYAQNSVSSE